MKAVESISVAINQIDEKKENLKKAFDDLQTHRSLLSHSFNLSWSEIDSHFSSLQSSLFNRFRLLQSAATSPDFDRIEASTTVATLLWPQLRNFCEKMDGKGLGKYIIDNSRKRASINLELPAAIRCSENPAALVLDAIEGSYHCSPSSTARAIDGRRVFVLLLEALIKINANITNDLRERARTLAIDWKSIIGNKPSEALGFLHLVAVFELVSIFKTEQLDDYVFMISRHKQVTTICKKIGLDKTRISNLIDKLLSTGRLLVSIRFIYEFGMTDEFPPVHILKTSLKNSREAAKRICAEGKNSLQAQNEATDKELNALRAVIQIVKEKNLESEFVEEKLEDCIHELAKEKARRKRGHKAPSIAKPQQPQHQLGNKRPRVANGANNLTIPPPSQQPPLLPTPGNSSQVNPYGLVSSTIPGGNVPYRNPLALHGSGPAPVPVQPIYYEQQRGYVGYGLGPQFQPPYYHL